MVGEDLLLQAGEIRPGDHLVALYSSEEDIAHYIVSYIHTALARNERCLYIAGDDDPSAVQQQVDHLSRRFGLLGELVVLDKTQVYTCDGRFSPDRLVETLSFLAEEALNDGYKGLAVTGELSWLLDHDGGEELIIEYEWKLNQYVFDRYPVSALCRYNVNKFPAHMVRDIIQLHPIIIWKGKIHENPYYIPPEGYQQNTIASFQVNGWLENIDNFTNAKSRFTTILAEQKEVIRQLHETMTAGVITSFLKLLETHDEYTRNHCQKVATLAVQLAKRVGMSQEFTTKIYYAALAHDIGKTLIPREILNKSVGLSAEEYEEIKRHPLYGSRPFVGMEQFEEVAQAIRHHHERYGGGGYPDRLVGESIPLMARIIAICDSYGAMTNDRPYRKARSHNEALQEILACAGTQFDPELVSQFMKLF